MTSRLPVGAAIAGLVLALVLGGVLWSRGAAAPEAPPRAVVAGRDLYATHCATCHGPEARGDGPSAAGFATKPTNLADGRIMNPLPDEFLVNVILHGGPAEGLAPTMPPFDAYLGEAQARDIVAYLRTLADPPFRPEMAKPVVAVPGAPAQPIFFSHLIHAGSYQIPCQYCHADARRSEYAGLPSVERCMGCHRIIGAQDNPEIQKIHEYAAAGKPIPWVRIFKVPEFTYFPHKPHVQSGLACQTCHGPIERMRVVGAETGPRLANDLAHLIGLRPGPPLLSMGWCLECHREQNATRGTRAPLDCISCHH
ncbi:MAG TPA: c-type cytochrome [Candidatus Tectomicrobia bacterium]|nr:c-type cytochrome [Candidatus Tectomicrobia bacterium]